MSEMQPFPALFSFLSLIMVGFTVVDTSLILMIRESSKAPKADITPKFTSVLTFCSAAFPEQAGIQLTLSLLNYTDYVLHGSVSSKFARDGLTCPRIKGFAEADVHIVSYQICI